jgi:hypothetical protein
MRRYSILVDAKMLVDKLAEQMESGKPPSPVYVHMQLEQISRMLLGILKKNDDKF